MFRWTHCLLIIALIALVTPLAGGQDGKTGTKGGEAPDSHKWKKLAEQYATELATLKANFKTEAEAKLKLLAELNRLKADFAEAELALRGRLAQKDLQIEQQKKKITKHKDTAQLAILNMIKALKETDRFQKEIAFLSDIVKDREKQIAKTQAMMAQFQQQYQGMLAERNSAVARAENLFQQLKEKEILLNKVSSVRDPNFLNPPAVNIKGSIQHIDKADRSLVKISVGSEAGLQKDHTLEVYRLSPQPEYLGRLRVLAAFSKHAIGRVVRPANMPNASPLKEGDQVATKLTP